MKISTYHSYDELPLFLNAELVAKVLGVSISSAYELMHDTVTERSSVPRQRYTPRRKSGAGTGMVHGRPKAERGESRILF